MGTATRRAGQFNRMRGNVPCAAGGSPREYFLPNSGILRQL